MSNDDSVTRWIGEIKQGNTQAAESLWRHYFGRIVEVARKNLKQTACRISDEEDVALSVFDKFFQGAEDGKFPDLSDREGLWRLLIKMTANKSIDYHRKESRARRGGGNVRGESAVGGTAINDRESFAEFMSCDPTPEFVTMMSEHLQSLLDGFEDPELRELVVAKMEGYTNEEIADKLNVSTRTIERRLRLIREHCRQELDL